MPPAQPTQRLRLTVWASPHLLTDVSMAGGKGICDEIALLSTIVNDDDLTQAPSGDLDWAKHPLKIELSDTVSSAGGNKLLATAIRAAHNARMQIFAGYRLVDAKFKAPRRFNAWLRSLLDGDLASQRSAEITRFATLISDFLDQDFGAGDFFDGISFDIETVAWHHRFGDKDQPAPDDPVKADQIGDVLREFYRTLADLLRIKGVLGAGSHVASQNLAVAPGGLVDATHSHSNVGGGAPAGFSFIAHGYQMALDRVNFIVRPMAYDNFRVLDDAKRVVDNTAAVDRWHKEIIDYALGEGAHAGKGTGVGLAGRQFQLGVKISKGPSNDPRSPQFINLDGVMDDHGWVVRRCGELRQRGVGLCVFGFSDVAKLGPGETVANKSKAFWDSIRDFDAKLNPPAANGQPLRGDVISQPAQCPHEVPSLARLR